MDARLEEMCLFLVYVFFLGFIHEIIAAQGELGLLAFYRVNVNGKFRCFFGRAFLSKYRR